MTSTDPWLFKDRYPAFGKFEGRIQTWLYPPFRCIKLFITTSLKVSTVVHDFNGHEVNGKHGFNGKKCYDGGFYVVNNGKIEVWL